MIKKGFLKRQVDRLNRIVGIDPKTVQYNTVGAYLLESYNDGFGIERVVNESGGTENFLGRGVMTKTNLSGLLSAYTIGLETKLKEKQP